MRILIVNIYFHPDPTGTGLVITELARDLAAQGHNVTVITSVPHYCRGGGGAARARPRAFWGPPPRGEEGGVAPPPRGEAKMARVRVLRPGVLLPLGEASLAPRPQYVT